MPRMTPEEMLKAVTPETIIDSALFDEAGWISEMVRVQLCVAVAQTRQLRRIAEALEEANRLKTMELTR